jgi:ATP-dependent Lhr-like helicase
MGLVELIGHGRASCDSFGGLRRLITPPSRRRGVMKRAPLTPAGRWWLLASEGAKPSDPETTPAAQVEAVGRRLLERYGVVFKRMLTRERIPVPWRDLVRLYRHQELRGDLRGGRFVQRFSGEQYALPEAVELMRRLRRSGQEIRVTVSAADPLNLQGILTPDERLSPQANRRLDVG